MNKLNIPMPKGKGVLSIEEGIIEANRIGYPVLVRPSFVLGGRMMHIVYDEASLRAFIKEALDYDSSVPVLVDKYVSGQECEVDAVFSAIPELLEDAACCNHRSCAALLVRTAPSLHKPILNGA